MKIIDYTFAVIQVFLNNMVPIEKVAESSVPRR